MKKKNAFTLIELLAVIVILAIIALIAVPQVMKILYQARLKSAEDATYGMIKSTENFLSSQVLTDDLDDNDFEFICESDGVCHDEKNDNYVLDYKGQKIVGGTINVVNRQEIQVVDLIAFGFKCNKDFDEEIVHCTPLNGSEKPQGQTEVLLKEGISCGTMTEENYDTTESCYIENMNDFNGFRSLINEKNKDFSNKKVFLLTDLSFSGLDYTKIGKTVNFKGNFFGNNKTLSNITISGASDNTGIFQTNEGTIEYLQLSNITITGSNTLGALVGTNSGTIKGITARNTNITGNINVGGLVGYNSSYLNTVIVDSTVQGNGNIGGVVGGQSYNNIGSVLVTNANVTCNDAMECSAISGGSSPFATGIVEKANITGTNERIGCQRWGVDATNTYYGYCLSEVKINNVQQTTYEKDNNSLSAYDKFLDTYINGDNDSDNYYFDYDKNGNIIIKNKLIDQLTFDLQGEGSINSPYLITSADDWKKATLQSNETGAYFKITKDIDFKNQKFYTMNTMAGYLDGDGHTLSNIKIHGIVDSIGMIKQNSGVIENLKLNNVTITGNASYAGSLVGQNTASTIKGITATNINVTGNSGVGGIVGYNNGGSVTTILIDSRVSGYDKVGGVQGADNQSFPPRDILVTNAEINCHDAMECSAISASWGGGKHGVVESGNIIGTSDRIGCHKWGVDATDTYYGYCLSEVKINGVYQTTYAKGNDPLTNYNPFIDTYIDGDSGDGYFFGYDSSNNIIIKKA